MRAYADNDYPADHKPDWQIIAGLWPYLIQLFVALNALGFVDQEIRQALVNVERLFKLLSEPPKVTDHPDAPALNVSGGT